MSLREKKAAAMHRQMLDTAELMIRQSGGTDFSMRALAASAEVSPTTPYNFFGSKEGLLYELLERNLKSFMKDGLAEAQDPIAHAIDSIDNAVAMLLRDPVLLRPLYQVMLGLTDPVHHPRFLKRAFSFYRSALDPAVARKLVDAKEQTTLACAMMAHLMGVLDLWVHEDIDDDGFRVHVAYGIVHLLWPYARGKSLTCLKQRFEELRKRAAKHPAPKFLGA